MNNETTAKRTSVLSIMGSKRRFRAALLGLAAGATIISATSVGAFERNFDGYGQDEHKMKRQHQPSKHMIKKMAKYLDLTTEQKESMRTIVKASRESKKADREEMKAFKLEMKKLVQADSFDEQAVRALHQQQQEKIADKMVAMAKMKHEMFQVLMIEQKEKWVAFQDKRKSR